MDRDGTTWRLLRSRVRSFAVAADGTLYAASAVARRLYRSQDDGASWTRINAVPLPFASPGVLAVAPDDLQTLYAAAGRQVWRSNDGGRHWVASRSTLLGFARCLTLLADRPGHVLVGTTRGLFASGNRGTTFARTGEALRELQVVDLAPGDGATQFVAAESLQPTAVGAWRSDNGGASWQPATNRLHAQAVTAWASEGEGEDRAFVGGGLLWRGTPGAFTPVRTRPRSPERPGTVTDLLVEPTTGTLLSADSGRLLASDDGGRSFTSRNAGWFQGLRWLHHDPLAGLLAGGAGPLLASTNQGDSWQAVEAFPPATVDGTTPVARNPTNPDHMVLLGWRAESWQLDWRAVESTDGGVSWQALPLPELPGVAGGAETRRLTFASNGDLVLAGASAVWRRLTEGWERNQGDLALADLLAVGETLWALEAVRPGERPHLLRSTDAGASWSRCDAGLEQLPTATRLAPSTTTGGLVVLGTAGAWVRTGEPCPE